MCQFCHSDWSIAVIASCCLHVVEGSIFYDKKNLGLDRMTEYDVQMTEKLIDKVHGGKCSEKGS